MNFIVYDSEGRILRTGTCAESEFEAQAAEGQFVMEGMASDAHHRIRNGEVIEFETTPPPPPVGRIRALAYPSHFEYLDAKVKQASADPAVRAEGLDQEARYLADCLAVKAQIPKPTDKEQ